MPIKLLHFADAHIDIANYGKHDPTTLLPIRVMDFLQSLDQIVDRAINEKVDLVIFAGDAYKDRNPHPTFQREWGKRMMRLSTAGIPTILLVGNHDVSPAAGRAHALHEFATLQVPNIFVADQLALLGAEQLGIAAQVITIPWVSRSALMTREETSGKGMDEVMMMIEERVDAGISQLLAAADPSLPLILTAHASVEGAKYGSERAVMIGHELTLKGGLVNNKQLDYVALGHIHKHQSLNGGSQPPIIYPGSIERIDFGEANEPKGYILAEVDRGHTSWEFSRLKTRRFLTFSPETLNPDSFMADVMAQLPAPENVTDTICRVQLSYPRNWENLIDEATIANRFSQAFSYQLVKHFQIENRSRLGDTVSLEQLSPLELLQQYWLSLNLPREETAAIQALAQEIFAGSQLNAKMGLN